MTFLLEKFACLKNGQPRAVKPSRCCGERHGAEAKYIHLTTEAQMTFALEKLACLKNGQPRAVKPSRCCGERHGAEAEYIHLTTEA